MGLARSRVCMELIPAVPSWGSASPGTPVEWASGCGTGVLAPALLVEGWSGGLRPCTCHWECLRMAQSSSRGRGVEGRELSLSLRDDTTRAGLTVKWSIKNERHIVVSRQ